MNNSALWPRPKDTYLNIVASDLRPLGRYAPPSPYTADNEWKRDLDKLSINSPVTALDHILSEFQRFVPFEEDEIVMERLEIDRNVGRELFINDVGELEVATGDENRDRQPVSRWRLRQEFH